MIFDIGTTRIKAQAGNQKIVGSQAESMSEIKEEAQNGGGIEMGGLSGHGHPIGKARSGRHQRSPAPAEASVRKEVITVMKPAFKCCRYMGVVMGLQR